MEYLVFYFLLLANDNLVERTVGFKSLMNLFESFGSSEHIAAIWTAEPCVGIYLVSWK